MGEFIPFHRFLEEVRSARPEGDETSRPRAAAPPGSGHPGSTEAERDRMRDYLRSHYRDAEVVHSFVDDQGQYIDCIKAGTQPGLQGGPADATPPAFAEMPGTGGFATDQVGPRDAEPRVDRYGNVMACPPGTIPVRRITLEQMSRAGTLENYFQKAPGGGALPPTPGAPRGQDDSPPPRA